MRKSLLALLFLGMLAGTARADIPRLPEPQRPAPQQPAPPPATPPASKVCGTGMGLVILGIGIFAALRLSKPRASGQEEPRSVA
jgi:hypothetical protein